MCPAAGEVTTGVLSELLGEGTGLLGSVEGISKRREEGLSLSGAPEESL